MTELVTIRAASRGNSSFIRVFFSLRFMIWYKRLMGFDDLMKCKER